MSPGIVSGKSIGMSPAGHRYMPMPWARRHEWIRAVIQDNAAGECACGRADISACGIIEEYRSPGRRLSPSKAKGEILSDQRESKDGMMNMKIKRKNIEREVMTGSTYENMFAASSSSKQKN